VVVPPLIMMVEPSSTNDAASTAIVSFSVFCRLSRTSTALSTRETVDKLTAPP
jgi:hypothetical protein